MKFSLIPIWPSFYRKARRDIVSVLNRKNYIQGLKTIGKWLSTYGTTRNNWHCEVVISLMISMSRRREKTKEEVF